MVQEVLVTVMEVTMQPEDSLDDMLELERVVLQILVMKTIPEDDIQEVAVVILDLIIMETIRTTQTTPATVLEVEET